MLSQRLKQFRESCGLTQKQIAEVLNVDRSTYTYYETGKSQPTIDTLIKLAKIFSVSIDALLDYRAADSQPSVPLLHDAVTLYHRGREGVSANTPLLNDDEKKMVLLYRLLDETDKKSIHATIQSALERAENS